MQKLNLRYWQWLILVVLLIFFTNLGSIYINLMEARNMLTAREMVDMHHWILTTIDNLPRYEKPPLPTWITAAFGAAFGFKSFVIMRLPVAFMSLLLVWMTYKFSQLIVNQKQSFIAALILATNFYMMFSGRTNQWDAYTHSFMMVSLFYTWKFLQDDDKLYRNMLWAAIFWGFSFLSKGPISVHALWLPFLISYGIIYKFRGLKKRRTAIILFFVIGIVLGGWWFVYVRLADPASFVRIMDQETEAWKIHRPRPFYYYWPFFIHTGIWAIFTLVSVIYPYMKKRVSDLKAYQFSLLWALFSLILLSVVPNKKPRYLLPFFIPMAITTSFYVEFLFRKFKELSTRETWVVYVNQLIFIIILLAFPVGGYLYLKPTGVYIIYFIASAVLLFAIGIAMFYYLVRKKDFPKAFYLIIAMVCVIMAVGFPLNELFVNNPEFNSPSKLRTMAQKEHFKVYEYGKMAPQIIWEYGEAIPLINVKDPKLPAARKFGIIIQQDDQKAQDWIKSLQINYKIIKTARYDVNNVNPKKHGYKDWLVRSFFLLEKK